MSAYTDAAAAICAFVERCGNKPAAQSAAIRSVAAHRRLDARRLSRLVIITGWYRAGRVTLPPTSNFLWPR